MTPEAVVQRFAQWSHEQQVKAGDDPGEFDSEYAQDYLENYKVEFTEGDDEDMTKVISVYLGAFDHGAGMATLVFCDSCLVVFYELSTYVILSGPNDSSS